MTTPDLAARKQALLADSGALRQQAVAQAQGLAPAFAAADALRAGWRWVRANPLVPVALGVAVVVARPRLLWRIARRAWLGWQLWQRVQLHIQPQLTALRRGTS